jgi:hypothetical protein
LASTSVLSCRSSSGVHLFLWFVDTRLLPLLATALMCGTCTAVSSMRWLSKVSPHGQHQGTRFLCRQPLAASHIAYLRAVQSRCFGSRKTRQAGRIGIDWPNEDHGPVVRFDVGRVRWRSVQSTNQMRRSLGSFRKSVFDTRPSRGRDGNGPEKRMLWYGTTATSGKTARVDSSPRALCPSPLLQNLVRGEPYEA